MQNGITRLADFQDRAGLRVSLAETQEIKGHALGENRQVCLGVSSTNPGCMTPPLSFPDQLPDFPGEHRLQFFSVHGIPFLKVC
jgi:hypothetical protein